MHHQAGTAGLPQSRDFKVEPLLATEWKLPDTTTIEFTLRPGVKFHDGSPLTADDVVTRSIVSDPASSVDARELQLDREGGEDRRNVGLVTLKRPTRGA